MAEFLFEIGLEEVPARMIAGAQAELERRVVGMLRRTSLLSAQDQGKAVSFSTPRRLAVFVPDVFTKQNDSSVKSMGPAVGIGFKEGKPTPAAEAFARKNGVTVEELTIESTSKGEYLVAETTLKGRLASEVIAAELPKELAGIYWSKNMYWRPGKPERFVRPVRWMVALLGDEVVPVSFGGYEAGAVTYGHRVLFGDEAISLKGPGLLAVYEEAMRKGFVVAEVEVRRQKIRKALDAVTRTVPGLRWREDHELVETVTQLTEWPSVLLGGFEKEYLALPEEVLVTVMRDHQKYFAVEDEGGRLAPYFLAVLNTEADEAGLAVIRHGNERVLRARFNDARFFWEFDQRVPMVERVKLLENVTFQKDLGSYAAKTERVRKVAAALAGLVAGRGVAVDASALDTAASLAKTDLTAELVKEFTELQGVVGGLYARAQGFPAAVGDAIYDQYKPVSMEDSVPRTVEGALLAIADKADTISGMFGLGLEPTGSKDPFALRRAANGIVKILAETEVALPLTLDQIAQIVTQNSSVAAKVRGFYVERLEFYLREAKGQTYDVVKAVLAIGSDDVRDAVVRAEAVTAMRGSEDFAAVSAAFKRMKNILIQAGERGERPTVLSGGNPDPAQIALLDAAEAARIRVTKLIAEGDYVASLETIATLRPHVDKFFEEVMVLDPNPAIRETNLVVLGLIVDDIRRVADLSEIVVAG
jgi:glycyl-tRNA synthetase beta chain